MRKNSSENTHKVAKKCARIRVKMGKNSNKSIHNFDQQHHNFHKMSAIVFKNFENCRKMRTNLNKNACKFDQKSEQVLVKMGKNLIKTR